MPDAVGPVTCVWSQGDSAVHASLVEREARLRALMRVSAKHRHPVLVHFLFKWSPRGTAVFVVSGGGVDWLPQTRVVQQ